MFNFDTVKEHNRNYPFRPPRHDKEDNGTDWKLYGRFAKRYVWPKRWSLLLRIILLIINSNAVYLMAFYTRLVVDDILVIQSATTTDTATAPSTRAWAPERDAFPDSRPTVSLGRRIDMGFTTSSRPPGAGRRLFKIAILYILTQITLNFLARYSTRQYIIVSQGITGNLREDMHQKVLDLSLSFHQTMSPGRLLSRILSDVTSVQVEMMAFFTSATHCVSMIITGSLVLLYEDWRMALLAFSITPVYAIMYRKRRPLIRHLNQEMRHTNSCLYGLVSQKIDGMKAIQAYAREKSEILNFHRLTACYIRDALLTQHVSVSLNRQAGILTSMSSCAIFLTGGYLVLKGEITLGRMMFLHSTTMTLFQPVLEFSQLPFVLQRLRVALLRVVSILDRPLEIIDAPDAVDFPSPLHSGVELSHVSFSYPAPKEDKESTDIEDPSAQKLLPPVLNDINLFVPAGSWLCIMGASGSGKSTLLNILSRLYEPTHGKVFVDGINLNKIRMLSLRHAVGVVPQEAQIFSGSMKDNICYGYPNATNTQIIEAAKAAQMHDFILEMKAKYETLIGQKGTNLSGGQRQRLSLARALLTDPELLILDDCTSALDANTERKIQETLERILVGKTAIMVSQRVSMAMRCHKICVLENGRVSEYGTHHELLELNGFYAKLFHQQTE